MQGVGGSGERKQANQQDDRSPVAGRPGAARRLLGRVGLGPSSEPPRLPERQRQDSGTTLSFDPTAELRETISPEAEGARVRAPRPGIAGRLMNVIAPKSDFSDAINVALRTGNPSSFIAKLPKLSAKELKDTLGFLETWERQSLYEMVSLAPQDAHTPNVLRILVDITEAASPALLPELHEKLAVVINQHELESHSILYQKVRHEITQALPANLPASRANQGCDLVVVTMIGCLLKTNPQARSSVAGFLRALPPQELTAMLSLITRERARQSDYAAFRELAIECIDTQRESAFRGFAPTGGLLQNSTRNPDTGRLHNPGAFANLVISADRNLRLFGMYGGNPQDLNALVEDIRKELTPLLLPGNLDTLDVPTLKDLQEAVAKLGGDTEWSKTTGKSIGDVIAKAIPARRQRDIEAHKEIAKSIVASLRRADAPFGVVELVRTITAAIDDHFNSPIVARGDWTLDQTVTALIKEIAGLVAEMPAAERASLAAAMKTETLGQLRAALYDMSRMAPDADNKAVLADLHRIETILDAIGKAAPAPIASFASLATDVRHALSVCGIGIAEGGALYFTTQLQTAIEQSLAAPAAPAKKAGVLHVPKVVYNIADVHSQVAREDLKEKLLIACRADPHLSQALRDTRLIQSLQDATSQVLDAMARSLGSGLIRTADGTPIGLLGNLDAAFSIRYDPKLGIVVQCTLLATGSLGLTGDPQSPAPVRLGGTASLRCDIAMGADGLAHVVGLPAFTNDIRTFSTWAESPTPLGVDDLLQRGAPPVIRKAYYDYVLAKHSEESYEFIVAVDELPEDDVEALRAAREIATTFIRPESEKFVNVADALTQYVLQAIDEPNPDIQKIRSRLRELRSAAVDLTNRDTFQRFRVSEELKTAVAVALEEMGVKEGSPKNAAQAVKTAKAKTPSTEFERSAVADLLSGPGASRQAARAKMRATSINVSLRLLANLSVPREKLEANAEFLKPQEDDAFRDLDVFQAHVRAFLGASITEPFDLATLRYNLERIVSDQVRATPQIKAVLAITIEAQANAAGAGFALMSPEAVLLQHAPPGLHSRFIAGWFRDNRITEASIAEFFRKIPDARKLKAKLGAIAGLTDREARKDVRDKLVAIGERELAARGVRVQTLQSAPRAPQRARQDEDLSWLTQSGEPLQRGVDSWLLKKRLSGLNPGDLPIVEGLAAKVADIGGLRSAQIRETLDRLSSGFTGDGWKPAEIEQLFSTLEPFGIKPAPTQAGDNAVPPPPPLTPATAGAEFIALANRWNPGESLTPNDATTLAALATLVEALKPQPNPLGQGLGFASGVPESATATYDDLREKLERQLESFSGEGWGPEHLEQLESLLSAVDTLNVDSRAVHLAILRLTAPMN
jgi:hypothetical protein